MMMPLITSQKDQVRGGGGGAAFVVVWNACVRHA
jgi:hypothetical protein